MALSCNHYEAPNERSYATTKCYDQPSVEDMYAAAGD